MSVHLNLDLVARLETMMQETASGEERASELGGILLGRVYEPNPEDFVVSIEEFEPLECSYKRGPSFTLSNRDVEKLAKRLRARRRELQPVGFFRSHTRHGLYLDEHDFRLLKAHFAHPASVALLARPGTEGPPQAGFFIWEDEEMQRTHSHLEFPLNVQALLPSGVGSPPALPVPVHPRPFPASRSFRPRVNTRLALMAVAVAAVILAVIAPFVRSRNESQPQPTSTSASHNVYALTANATSSGLRLSWNPDAPPLATADRGTLWIEDGPGEKRIDLDRPGLRSGSLDYVPSSPDVNFRLEAGGFSESLRASAPMVAPLPPAAPPTSEASEANAPAASQTRTRRQERTEPKVARLPGARAPQSESPATELLVPPTIAVTTELARITPPSSPEGPYTQTLALSTVEPVKPNVFRRAVGIIPGLRGVAKDRTHDDDYVPARAVRKFHPSASDQVNERVSVKISVDEKGRVSEAALLNRRAEQRLADAALLAATKWRFEPAKEKGKPVPSTLVVHFEF